MAAQLHFYVISLVAFTTKAISNEQNMAYFEHAPAVLIGRNLQDIEDQLSHQIYQRWPKEHGWSKHTAVATIVDKQFYGHLSAMIDKGLVELPDHGGEQGIIYFDPNDRLTGQDISLN